MRPGTRVVSKSNRSRLGTVQSDPVVRHGMAMCSVWWDGVHERSWTPLGAIEEYSTPQTAAERVVGRQFDSLSQLMARLTHEKIADPRADVLYSVRTAAADFHPYQFRPVVKLIREEAGGILIADEVGLGKTIEAGYILKELKARDRFGFKRAIIVCPATLRAKWQLEMSRRFGERFEILAADGFRAVIDRVAAKVGDLDFQVIVSYETIRVADIRERLSDLGPVDLVICDEAHHLRNPSTHVHRAIADFRDAISTLVLLSATPIQIRTDNLRALLSLIAPDRVQEGDGFRRQLEANQQLVLAESALLGGGPDRNAEVASILDDLASDPSVGIPQQHLLSLAERVRSLAPGSKMSDRLELAVDIRDAGPFSTILTRTRRRDVRTGGALRRPNVIAVEFSADERTVFDWCLGEAQRRYAEASEFDYVSRMASVGIQRMFSSSLQASLRQLVRDQALCGLEDESDAAPSGGAWLPDLPADVRRAADRLLASEIDSKYSRLLEAIRGYMAESPSEKFVVFSFYKRTLAYLESRLKADGIEVVRIDGDVPSMPHRPARDERGKRISRFRNDPGVRVLLSSEVGSEGLDFQDACSIVVNYDLPWNPMRIEQRIGRVDRYGQRSPTVTVINFKVNGTIEDDVYQRLLERIEIFRAAIGDLDEILGEIEQHVERIVMSRGLSREELDRIEADALRRVESLKQIAREVGDAQDLLVSRDGAIDEQAVSGTSVSAEELANFVESGLRAMQIDSVPGYAPRCTKVVSGTRLEEVMRRSLTKRDEVSLADVMEISPGGCLLQYEHPKEAHYISVAHPIVSGCVRFFKAAQADSSTGLVREFACAARVSVPELAAGTFLIGIARLTTSSNRGTAHSVEFAGCDSDGQAIDRAGLDTVLSRLASPSAECPASDAPRVNQTMIDAVEELVFDSRARVAGTAERRHELRAEMLYAKERRKLLYRASSLRRHSESSDFAERPQQFRTMTLGSLAKVERQLEELERSRTQDSPPTVEVSWIGFIAMENRP